MPAIEISQDRHSSLMALKPVIEQVIQTEMSEEEFIDFVLFSSVERLFLEATTSSDFHTMEALRKGDGVLDAVLDTLRRAQITLQALCRRYPIEVFTLVSEIWQNMNADERQEQGMGFGYLWEEYQKSKASHHE